MIDSGRWVQDLLWQLQDHHEHDKQTSEVNVLCLHECVIYI